jgi:hypothetical protein
LTRYSVLDTRYYQLPALAALFAYTGHVLAVLRNFLAALLTDLGHVVTVLGDLCTAPAADFRHVGSVLSDFRAALASGFSVAARIAVPSASSGRGI